MDPHSLDIEDAFSLVHYLRDQKRVGPNELPRIRVLAGGVSNKTVLVERESGEAWVLKQALPKLRVQSEWLSDPARVHREAEALRWLPRILSDSTTPLVFEDRDEYLLAMTAVPQPHENWKTMLLAGRIVREHVALFGRMLAELHRRSQVYQDELEAAFWDQSFFESLRVEPYYLHSADVVPAAKRFLVELVHETRTRRIGLVHGDYSPKNILIHEGQLVLLDHEVIHWGDPAFDVGFALTHLLSKANHLPMHRERFATAADIFWYEYSDNSSYESEWHIVRHTLGCLLARVAGRSPLEYLDDAARVRQQDAVLELMQCPPRTVGNLIVAFVKRLER